MVKNENIIFRHRWRINKSSLGGGLGKDMSIDKNHFDPRCMSLLNDFLVETGCKIVISSSWRKNHRLSELKLLFRSLGVNGEIIDTTPCLAFSQNHGDGIVTTSPCRGSEIWQWVNSNKELLGKQPYLYKDYVIFDDDSDMLYRQRNNLFLVGAYSGLTPNLIDKAKNFFK